MTADFARFGAYVRTGNSGTPAVEPQYFFQRNPEIIPRLADFDWAGRIETLRESFIDIYRCSADLEFTVRTVSFDLDDADFDQVRIAFVESSEYEAIRNELEVIQKLLLAAIQSAAIASVKCEAFAALRALR